MGYILLYNISVSGVIDNVESRNSSCLLRESDRFFTLPCRSDPNNTKPILGDKGKREVDFPLDDYFMALAVLGCVRSQCKIKVSTSEWCILCAD